MCTFKKGIELCVGSLNRTRNRKRQRVILKSKVKVGVGAGVGVDGDVDADQVSWCSKPRQPHLPDWSKSRAFVGTSPSLKLELFRHILLRNTCNFTTTAVLCH